MGGAPQGPAWRGLEAPSAGQAAQADRAAQGAAAAALRKGAQAHGFLNELWTLPRIAQVLESTCGVRLHPGHLWRVPGALGWSVQKPERRAFQRNEASIAHWKKHTWPALKKKPGAKGAPSS